MRFQVKSSGYWFWVEVAGRSLILFISYPKTYDIPLHWLQEPF
jgi:hypothetical protein